MNNSFIFMNEPFIIEYNKLTMVSFMTQCVTDCVY